MLTVCGENNPNKSQDNYNTHMNCTPDDVCFIIQERKSLVVKDIIGE